ncbi:NUDIX domain-containing protein [Micromonospora sp. NBS 11-29]|uniref:NUDIX domain-containing protein n=1 Tax=Micromonospora sp. NBS 11-29 TaxID=1960879 RepID=UPI0020CD7DBB|nr:NUDIX domain-containing protein [Micromonospora sp. NBS 11-29]
MSTVSNGLPAAGGRVFTHPDVLGRGVAEGWADRETDPTRIDWAARQAVAVIPFAVVDGRPVNPCESTGIRYGRNELGHWGEQVCADAVVTATDEHGRRWLVMVERSDGYGWALPGGHVEPGESPAAAAVRELGEETGLLLYPEDGVTWRGLPARYVPDPRASDEAWMVTVPALVHLTTTRHADFPCLTGADDATRAEWVPADSYRALVGHLASVFGGEVFPAHRSLLADLLG